MGPVGLGGDFPRGVSAAELTGSASDLEKEEDMQSASREGRSISNGPLHRLDVNCHILECLHGSAK